MNRPLHATTTKKGNKSESAFPIVTLICVTGVSTRGCFMSPSIAFYRARGKYGCFSNLYIRAIDFEGRRFRSAEDAYQFGKPEDLAVSEWFLLAPRPHHVAIAAHELLGWDVKPGWNHMKVARMRSVLYAKFSQHADLHDILLSTGNATLIEASKTDAFWGVGKKGNGKNMLGALLMEIRTALRSLETMDNSGGPWCTANFL